VDEETTKKPAFHPIRKLLVRAIDASGDAYTAAVDTVSEAVRAALLHSRSTGLPPADALAPVVLGAARGALESGADLARATTGIVVGIRHGSRERGEEALRTLCMAARIIVRLLATAGGDVAGATAGLIAGAHQGALDFGEEVDPAAEAAAQGALEGAEEAGASCVDQVRASLWLPFQGRQDPLLPAQLRKESP
jgi:hypothetical protein